MRTGLPIALVLLAGILGCQSTTPALTVDHDPRFTMLLGGSCGTAPNAAPEVSPDTPKITLGTPTFRDLRDDTVEEVSGRPFVMSVVEIDGRDGQEVWLSILGDHRMIQCRAVAQPFRYEISGNAIHFGGHTFTVTPLAGRYLADGQPITLEETSDKGTHVFVDGHYEGLFAASR